MPELIDRGVQVTSLRQLAPSLSPNAANDGWNYIVSGFTDYPLDIEWVVLKDFTTVPVEAMFGTTPHGYPNQLFSVVSLNQMRAQNGRIFIPLFANAFAVYRPDTEDIIEIGPFLEDPPINPNASTIPYSGSFDTSGMMFFATQESGNRPSCLVSVNPDTYEIKILGYFGTNAVNYTTYGYYTAPDTGTAQKGVWNVYGESTWQLWYTTLAGVSTLLYEVPSSGFISFLNIAGKGWVAQIHTNLGQPDDVYTQWWCLASPAHPNGQLYAYSPGDDPPTGLGRNVTPLTNPLVSPPELDTSGGFGVLGWRANGSSGAFTYVDYTITHAAPVPIEMLVTSPDGVLVGVEEYQGFVRYNASSHTGQWFGAQSGATIAQPLALYVPSEARIFMAGYPNGTLFDYDPAAPWDTYPSQVNPALTGAYGAGNQLAAIKYAGHPETVSTYGSTGSLVWDPAAGVSGRLYCAGERDRTGTGAGIGYWDKAGNTFGGTHDPPLDTVQPQGLVLAGPGKIAMSTNTLDGDPTAPLYVFDLDLTLIATQFPVAGVSNLGPIFPTAIPNVICGAYIDGGVLKLYRWNVQSGTMVQTATTAFAGLIDCFTINQADGSAWLAVTDTVVQVDPETLTAIAKQDVTLIQPLTAMAFYQTELYMGAYANLWSTLFTPAPPGAVMVAVADGMVRVTLAGGIAAGTPFVIGLASYGGGDPDLALPEAFQPQPYAGPRGQVSLQDAIEVDVRLAGTTSSVQVFAVVKTGTTPADFRATVTNLSGSDSPALEIYIGFHT